MFKFSNPHTCLCSGCWHRAGQSGGTRRKTILKDTARSPTSYQRLLSGPVIVFRTCDTIADDIANANADTKTPSSMICCVRQQGGGEAKKESAEKAEAEAGRSMAAEMLMRYNINAIALSL